MDSNAHGYEKVGSFAGDAKSFDTYTEECSGSMTQKDVLIRKLKNDLEHSRKQQQSTTRELRECELSIARLQGQIGKLQDEQALKRSDVAAKDQSLRVLEQQQVGSKVKVGFIKLKNMACFGLSVQEDMPKTRRATNCGCGYQRNGCTLNFFFYLLLISTNRESLALAFENL